MIPFYLLRSDIRRYYLIYHFGKAPEGSGVPVGTEHHWYILSHQNVKKINANDYTTVMSGLKYKLAHKGAGKDKWIATAKAQRKHLITFLQEFIAQLEKGPVPLQMSMMEKHIKEKQFRFLKPARMVCVLN